MKDKNQSALEMKFKNLLESHLESFKQFASESVLKKRKTYLTKEQLSDQIQKLKESLAQIEEELK